MKERASWTWDGKVFVWNKGPEKWVQIFISPEGEMIWGESSKVNAEDRFSIWGILSSLGFGVLVS